MAGRQLLVRVSVEELDRLDGLADELALETGEPQTRQDAVRALIELHGIRTGRPLAQCEGQIELTS